MRFRGWKDRCVGLAVTSHSGAGEIRLICSRKATAKSLYVRIPGDPAGMRVKPMACVDRSSNRTSQLESANPSTRHRNSCSILSSIDFGLGRYLNCRRVQVASDCSPQTPVRRSRIALTGSNCQQRNSPREDLATEGSILHRWRVQSPSNRRSLGRALTRATNAASQSTIRDGRSQEGG